MDRQEPQPQALCVRNKFDKVEDQIKFTLSTVRCRLEELARSQSIQLKELETWRHG